MPNTLTIHSTLDDSTHETERRATYGPLAVTRSIEPAHICPRWVITHVASGGSVLRCNSLALAKRLAKRLADSGAFAFGLEALTEERTGFRDKAFGKRLNELRLEAAAREGYDVGFRGVLDPRT